MLNLSLGWSDAGLRSSTLSTRALATGVAMVRREIRRARCSGALVLAATGESRTLCEPADALFPAAWEALTAPTAAACDTEFKLSPGWNGTATCRPLLYAVAGLNGAGRLLDGTPTASGLPRLAAPAFGVVSSVNSVLEVLKANHPGSCDPVDLAWAPTTTLTGSSMSTAAVSAAAAAVWALAPTSDADEVVQRLLDAGAPIPRPTPSDPSAVALATLLPACMSGANEQSRHIGVARSISETLTSLGHDCSALPKVPAPAIAQACCRTDGCASTPPPTGGLETSPPATSVPVKTDWCAAQPDPCCSGGEVSVRQNPSDGTCATPNPAVCAVGAWKYPLVNPAPTDPPCPPDECLISMVWDPTNTLDSFSLQVAVPADLGLDMDADEVVVRHEGQTHRISLAHFPQLKGMAPGSGPVEVTGLPFGALAINHSNASTASAELHMTLTGSGGRGARSVGVPRPLFSDGYGADRRCGSSQV